MERDFLPDYASLSLGGRYRPMFKLFTGESWRTVRRDGGKPMCCDTAGQAIAAAKEHVRSILNKQIRAERAAPADPLGLDAWHQQRTARAAEAATAALGGIIHKQRIIPVERRRRA